MKFRRTNQRTVSTDLRALADFLDGDRGYKLRALGAKDLNELLDRWHEADAFKPDGSRDPRGDHRVE